MEARAGELASDHRGLLQLHEMYEIGFLLIILFEGIKWALC